MREDAAFSALLDLVSKYPRRWMLRFSFDRHVELEYFGDGYSVELESGSGEWIACGELVDVVCKATTFVQLLQLIDGW